MRDKPLYVTSPLMPDYEDFIRAIKPLWDKRFLTNNGEMLREFERKLGEYLGEEYVTVYTNGTLPIMAACHALNLKGEVITTPYTFVATSHALKWCGLKPVYIDVDPTSGNMDPSLIESAITERSSAILPVHVYGQPCDVEAIKRVAEKYSLPVIYDAAHAFGVRQDGVSITAFGDLATLSFHATKVFNTLEGGAIISRSSEMKERLDRLRNFGFVSETSVTDIGINAKMDEMRATFGILNLQKTDEAIKARKTISEQYDMAFEGLNLMRLSKRNGVRSNYSHYPIFLADQTARDRLYSALREKNIFARKYFYPLVTDFPAYSKEKGAGETPVASNLSQRVLCLPIHPAMTADDIRSVVEIVRQFADE